MLADLLSSHGSGLHHTEQHLLAALIQEGSHRPDRLPARPGSLRELQRLGFAGYGQVCDLLGCQGLRLHTYKTPDRVLTGGIVLNFRRGFTAMVRLYHHTRSK